MSARSLLAAFARVLIVPTLPAGTRSLDAIWIAPTGQVFAVGSTGMILTGP